jgi:hypothetical protein
MTNLPIVSIGTNKGLNPYKLCAFKFFYVHDKKSWRLTNNNNILNEMKIMVK